MQTLYLLHYICLRDIFFNLLDKNMRKMPPFGDPALAGEEFDNYDFGVKNPENHPMDYDYKNPMDGDYDVEKDYWNPEKKPEKYDSEIFVRK